LNGEIVGFLRRTVMSFESWAERKKINLQFTTDIDKAECFFDGDKLGKIMNNLLSNALKYTPEGGSVDVSLRVPQIPVAPRWSSNAVSFRD
jgi:signal transduction histidine kinase